MIETKPTLKLLQFVHFPVGSDVNALLQLVYVHASKSFLHAYTLWKIR